MICEKPFDLTSVPVDQRLLELQAAKGGRKRSIGPLTPNAERQRRFRERRTQELSILAEENDELRTKIKSLQVENCELKTQFKSIAENMKKNLQNSGKRRKSHAVVSFKSPVSIYQVRKSEKVKLERKVDAIKAEISDLRKQNFDLFVQLKEVIEKRGSPASSPPNVPTPSFNGLQYLPAIFSSLQRPLGMNNPLLQPPFSLNSVIVNPSVSAKS